MTKKKKNETVKEIVINILPGNKCFCGLAKILQESQSLSKKLKIQLFITLLRPIITYDAEIRTLKKMEERKLICRELEKITN